MKRVAGGACFSARVGRASVDGVLLAETMTGAANIDGARHSLSAPMDRMALHAAGKVDLAPLPIPPAFKRMPPGHGRLARCVAPAANSAPRLSKEGSTGSAVGRVTILAFRTPDAPCVKISWFYGMVRMAPDADGAPPLPQ